ncbi:MAG: cupin domain-containing protein [Actinomycetota bacterium]|nr:cupin domain-containing protein [Actinomycetota bacterium]
MASQKTSTSALESNLNESNSRDPIEEAGAAGLKEIVNSIGPKLRELRAQRSLSLQQLADRSDVSAAAIHKIERNGMVPTITTLLKLAGALNRPVSYFVEEEEPDNRPISFTRADERRSVYTSHQGIDLAGISGPYGRFFVAGAVATIEGAASSGRRAMEHPGEELVLVVDGTFEIDVDGETFRLTEGDSLHWRTDRPHRWRNPTVSPAKAVWLALRPL